MDGTRRVRRPEYFESFRCLGGACPDSCCKEWAVQVDEASAERWRHLPGKLGEDLRQYLREEDGDIVLSLMPDGRCPMWRADGLCKLQADRGEGELCGTCREFPRLSHDYGDFLEQDLELSCPEAARLILLEPDAPVETREPGYEAPEYDGEAMEILLGSRENALKLLGDQRYSLPEALAALLLYGCRVQEMLDGGAEACFAPQKELETAAKLAQTGDMAGILEYFGELELLTRRWPERLAKPEPGPWLAVHRAAARYFVRRYWLQAVSDYDLLGRVKLILVSCLVLKALGGDPIGTAQLYSKEIENNASNVDALLDACYMEPAFADVKLLGLLLEDKR